MTQTVPLAHLHSSKPTTAESSSRKTLHGIALAVAKAKRIVVVTGAGISCSSGIPDFRSSDGLYNLVKERYPDVIMKGRDLFDAALFRDPVSAAVFYTFMAELKTQIDSAHPAPVHDFLAMLDDKGKLLRSYTQNIDGLEERAGLGTRDLNAPMTGNAAQRAKNVQLHGDIHRVRCTLCSASYPCSADHIASFRTGVPPDCPECIARSDARTARAARALKCGTLRPAIVLYDEPHPLGDHIGAVQTSDLGKKPDLLIVMGTSLKVHGLRLLVKSFAKAVHSSRPSPSTMSTTSQSFLNNVLFVNRTPPPPGEWTSVIDYHIQGDADAWVAHVLGEWRKSRPGDWEVQMRLDEVVAPKQGKLKDAKGKAKGDKTDDGKASKGKGVKGKDANVKAKGGKSKSKPPNPGSENQPPPSEVSTSKQRITITLRRKAKAAQSPLHNRAGKLRIGGKGKPGLGGKGKAPLGTPVPMKTPVRQASLTTPAKPGGLPTPSLGIPKNPAPTNVFTPMRPGQKRSAPAPSPFVSGGGSTPHTGQFRLDVMLSRSPAHKRAAVSTPTTERPLSAYLVKPPGNSTVARAPGIVSGLVKVHGERVVSGSKDEMEGVEGVEVAIGTTPSEEGALMSASVSDAGMDTTDVDDPPAPSLMPSAASSRVSFDIWAAEDLAAQSSAGASESEVVDQEEDDEDDHENDEAEEEEVEESEEVAEEMITLSQRIDQVDSEDMVMDSPDEVPATGAPISLPNSTSKPVSRTSISTRVSHVSSQTSHASTQDSIFSARGSHDIPLSSQEEAPIAESSQTTTCAPGSSQTVPCPLSQADSIVSQTSPSSPPQSPSESDNPQRYLGDPRPAPFGRVKSLGAGKVFKGRPLTRHVSIGSGSGSSSSRGASNPKATRIADPFARRPPVRSVSANWSAQHAPSGARRPGGGCPILIPGKDFGISATGERFSLTGSSAASTASDSEESIPLAQRPRLPTIVPPPPESGSSSSRQSSEKRELGLILSPNMAPRGHEPRKRNRLRDDSDSDMDDDKEPPRGLLFSSKGKEKESDSEMLIDVDPSDEEAGLDGAVGHMSLDGPSTDPDPDPDVDVVGVSSGVERVGLAVSPIQTRARRRVKEATAAASKRGKRVPRAGTRTSSRLAAMTGTS